MLGVTSINGCAACEAVHDRWAVAAGLRVEAMSPAEAEAWAFGERLAVEGPGARPPLAFRGRHRRELAAVGVFMELANLAGNRWTRRLGRAAGSSPDDFSPGGPSAAASPVLQVDDPGTARFLDALMRTGDRLGLAGHRRRLARGAIGEVLEIGVGTGVNLPAYPAGARVHGLDVSAPAMSLAAARARRLGREVVLVEGDAAALPFADDSFDHVVATFTLCSVGDVGRTLREVRRVLRPGGTVRLLEHARARAAHVGGVQERLAPAWARASGGCRLDHDVVASVRDAGFAVLAEDSRFGGLLVAVVAD
jgi:AhpD family alkylhydroperoxidase